MFVFVVNDKVRDSSPISKRSGPIVGSAFYFAGPINDWTAPQNADLWRDGLKTLFDPCPSGWRVPRGGPDSRSAWNAFRLDNSLWNGADTDPMGGRTFDRTVVFGGAGTCWYPAGGIREVNSWFAFDSYFTHNWTSTADYQFHTTAYEVQPNWNYESRSRAYSVRCVRE